MTRTDDHQDTNQGILGVFIGYELQGCDQLLDKLVTHIVNSAIIKDIY